MKLRFDWYSLSICIVTMLVCFTSQALHADTVTLKNGDRITGTALKLDGGKLTVKNTYSDAITISWDEVTGLTLTQPLLLTTPKGTVSVTSIERTDAGLVVTTPSGPITLAPAAVKTLRTPADQQTYEDSLHPGWGHAWAGNVNLSLALAHGNSETTTFSAGFTAVRVTNTDKTLLYANYLYSTNANSVPETSANASAGGLHYDHNLKPKVFVYGSGDFNSDALQDLDLRSKIGGGIGWHALKSKNQTFDLMAGVSWIHEVYSPTPTNSFTALSVGEIYSRRFGAGSLLTEQFYFYPDLNDFGDYQFTAASTFSTKIGKIFTWQTTFTDNYTSFPPVGKLPNDLILTTGLGITLTRK
jgi:putative salt-induced outer membrane protein